MLRPVIFYGLALAAAALALQWLDFQLMARAHAGAVYIALIAAGFMGLGVWVGARLFQARARTAGFTPNLAAQAALGVTERELEVLALLAAGRANKEIAHKLEVSPNTVKTHLANLYAKLEARRRTEAVLKARELGLIP